MNVRRKVDKDPCHIMTHQVFPTIRTIITKGSSAVLVKDIFFVVVVGCTSTTLYKVISTWHLVLAFMLKSYVCMVALNSPSPFIRRCDGGGGGSIITLSNAPGPSIYYFVFVVVLYLFIHPFFLFFINYPDMAWLRQQGLSNYYIIFYSLSIFSKISFSGWQR